MPTKPRRPDEPVLRARLNPKIARRLATGFIASLLLLAAVLGLGFHAGAGCAWARQAVMALAGAALLAGIAIAWFVTRSISRSTHDAAKVAQRLDRVFQHVNAKDS
ncbi:hypothetical protein ACGLHS_08535 [Variovorax sp. VaC1]|uniref:hypothetical protein n=1 Tax=Variovorax sp. VaC1 TaxID=3373132 RepID=UPI0037489C33